MIRILQCVNDMHRAGLETMLMNYYRNMDRSKIQFDFLTHRSNRSDYDEEIEALGGKIYYAPRLYPQNYPAYFSYMKHFFAQHPEYKIMHSHIDAMSYLPLLAGKKAGVPIRIAHSHNTSIDKDFKYILKQLFRLQITNVANVYLACGFDAGEYLFRGKTFKVIPNAVEAKNFYFNQVIREGKRRELKLENKYVVGHIGRLSYQKNHKFLLEIFKEILKSEPMAILLLVGIGKLEEEIRKQAKKMEINEKVLFLGNRSDVDELYQAMDVFVLPSLFEGIPVVGIEAQFADLPCFFSDKVPEEVKFNSKSYFMSLNDSAEQWAKKILQSRTIKRGKHNSVQNSCYNIENAHSILESMYIDLYKSIPLKIVTM